MKFNLRRATWAFAVAITFTLLSVPNFVGAYQRDGREYQRDDHEHDRGRDANPYGRQIDQAAEMGRQDGLNDGRKDRATGHSNRPTKGDNYKNATRGFAGGAGQTAYKAAYRQAYEPAYQQGYNERMGRR